MAELPSLLLALVAVSLTFSLLGALRRAGRQAALFAVMLAANLVVCGLVLSRPEPQGPLLWAALLAFLVLVLVPRLIAGLQTAALRAGDGERALRLLRARAVLQPGAHQAGLRVLEALASRSSRAAPLAGRELLDPHLEPAVRLALLEAIFAELASAGRGEQLLALLEEEGRESLLALSPRIAALAGPFLVGAGRLDEAGRAEAAAAGGAQRVSARREPIWRQAPASLALLALIAVVQLFISIAGGSDETWALLRAGANYPPASLHGEPWRLLTSVFLHGGLLHLAVNAYALYGLGRFIEPIYRSARIFIIFILAGLCGSTASALLGGPERLSVGASGAIFGLLGAALMMLLRLRGIINEAWRRQVTFNLLIIIALNLYIGYSLKVVDNWAHLGGLAGGLIGGLLLAPQADELPAARAGALLRAVAAGLALLLAASAVLAALTPIARTLGRQGWRHLERTGLRVEAPARMTLAAERSGLTLRDPLMRAQVELGVDLLEGGRSLEQELAARVAATRKDLEGEPGVGEVGELPPELVGLFSSPGVARAGFRLRLGDDRFAEVLLLRREGTLLLQARVLLPVARLAEAAPVLRRIFSSLRYQRVSGPGT